MVSSGLSVNENKTLTLYPKAQFCAADQRDFCHWPQWEQVRYLSSVHHPGAHSRSVTDGSCIHQSTVQGFINGAAVLDWHPMEALLLDQESSQRGKNKNQQLL